MKQQDVTFGARELLGAMQMQVTIRVPRSTVWVVRARLTLARWLVRLAALAGGCAIALEQGEPDSAQGEGG